MRESRPYGSVRGALSNERSYRDYIALSACLRQRRHGRGSSDFSVRRDAHAAAASPG